MLHWLKHIIPKSFIALLLILPATFVLYRQLSPLHRLIQDFPLNDFSVYLDGTRTAMLGKNPYEFWFFDRYNYSPGATLLFVPFVSLPPTIAEYVVTIISLGALWWTMTWLLKLENVKLQPAARWLLFALLVKLFPVKLTFILGQINLFVLFLIVGSFYCYRKKRPWLAGVLLGLASAIKLTPVLLLLFYWVKKEKTIIKSTIISIVGLTLLGIGVFGLGLTNYYYLALLPELFSETSRALVKTDYMNQSVTALLGRFGIFETNASIVRNVLSLIGLVFLIKNRPSTKGEELRWFSSLLILATLIAPIFVWQHHFVFTIPAFLVLVSAAVRSKRLSWFVISVVSYFLFDFYFRDPSLPPQQHPLITTHFLVVTLLVVFITWKLPSKFLDAKQK